MSTQTSSVKKSSLLMQDAQTLFLTAAPHIRYSIAITLLMVVAAMVCFVPHFDVNYAYAYAFIAGVYGWELSLGMVVMAGIVGVFKLLALLPLGIAIPVVICVLIFAGV